ncbi:MAG: alanine racemase [Cyclobacteriaceae bacterium]
MLASSTIELDYSALLNNLQIIRGILGPDIKFSSVVKGNAYGHGISEFVSMAETANVDHFSVFSAGEAFSVKKAGSNPQVLIMGFIDDSEVEWAVENDVEFFVFESGRLQAAINAAKKLGKKARIHIEFETGLNRTGFSHEQLVKVVPIIQKNLDNLEVCGDCTHYAGAESIANYVRVKSQIKKFNKMDRWLRSNGINPLRRHTACSAAAMSYPKSRMDMVRIGILQYGFWPSRETIIDFLKNKTDRVDPLKRVIKWKSTVMDVKEVNTGEFIGYGTTFMASENMKVATVPVGYSHGYSRSLSNQGRVLICGKRLAVIGIVNMNILMVDISEAPEVKKGDEVVLIGDQGDQSVSVASFSELSSQLNYELLTRLPHNIPRKVVNTDALVTKNSNNGLHNAEEKVATA